MGGGDANELDYIVSDRDIDNWANDQTRGIQNLSSASQTADSNTALIVGCVSALTIVGGAFLYRNKVSGKKTAEESLL